jgi:hypothetical protein
VQKAKAFAQLPQPVPMSIILMTTVLVHLPLLLIKLPLNSYDSNSQIFFASYHVHHWFDPWNAIWYAGFSQATYPFLPQQWVALVSRILGLDMAYMAVHLAAILLLAVGIYLLFLRWVSPRSASIAALASVFLGSKSSHATLDQNRPELLKADFVGAAKDRLADTVQQQRKLGIRTRYQDRSHELEILFYSPDGMSIELTDKVEYDVQVIDRDKVITTEREKARYLVVLTPAEVRWRMRVFQSVPE